MQWPFNEASREIVRALVQRRRALGLSQWDVDMKLGCAMGYTAKLEVGMRCVSGPLLSDWAKVLGCELVLVDVAPTAVAERQSPSPTVATSAAQNAATRSNRGAAGSARSLRTIFAT